MVVAIDRLLDAWKDVKRISVKTVIENDRPCQVFLFNP